jgi:hypothetical protein
MMQKIKSTDGLGLPVYVDSEKTLWVLTGNSIGIDDSKSLITTLTVYDKDDKPVCNYYLDKAIKIIVDEKYESITIITKEIK